MAGLFVERQHMGVNGGQKKALSGERHATVDRTAAEPQMLGNRAVVMPKAAAGSGVHGEGVAGRAGEI